MSNAGENLRKETASLVTALRKPQVRGAWGELQLRRVAEYAGMVDRCDFDEQASATTSADRAIRPDMRVNLSDGKFLYVDAKVPLSAFLEAHETEDERSRAEKLTLFDLLDVPATAGIELTESMAMWPGASVSGWYFSHPQSQYFVVGRLARDQVADYARRKGWTLPEAEKWLSANLGYDPDD